MQWLRHKHRARGASAWLRVAFQSGLIFMDTSRTPGTRTNLVHTCSNRVHPSRCHTPPPPARTATTSTTNAAVRALITQPGASAHTAGGHLSRTRAMTSQDVVSVGNVFATCEITDEQRVAPRRQRTVSSWCGRQRLPLCVSTCGRTQVS